MSYDGYLIHMYTHHDCNGHPACPFCETMPPVPATCTPENPITAEEAAEPFTLIERITLRPAKGRP